jgi:transcription termination factor Rho
LNDEIEIQKIFNKKVKEKKNLKIKRILTKMKKQNIWEIIIERLNWKKNKTFIKGIKKKNLKEWGLKLKKKRTIMHFT